MRFLRRRFWILALIGAVAFLAVGWLFLPRLSWDGDVPRKVHLTVIDPATASPIAGASVNFNGRDVGVTDAAGVCEWMASFPAGGSSGLFGRSGEWLIHGALRIETEKGISRTIQLEEYVRERDRPLSQDGVKLKVPLDEGESSG